MEGTALKLRLTFIHDLTAEPTGKSQTNFKTRQKAPLPLIPLALSVLTFGSLAVYLRTTRFNIQKFYMVLALR